LAGILEDHPDLRMVMIAGDGPESAGPAAALAAALHEASGLTAVATGGLGGAHEADFCAACYAVVAAGEPADVAVTAGRAGLAEAGGLWGAPQIMLAPGGEDLFRIGAAAPPRPERAAAPPARRSEGRRKGRGGADRATPIFEPIARPQPRPALRGRTEAPVAPPWLSRRAIALVVASLILILMVGRSLRWPDATGPTTPTPLATPTALLLPTARGEAPAAPAALANTGDTTHNVIRSDLTPTAEPATPTSPPTQGPRGNPLDAPPPTGFATYLAAEGDTPDALAQRSGSDPQAILAINRLAAGEPMRAGRPLVVPIYRAGAPLPEAPIIARGSTARPEVALTFDIEIDERTLYSILDILEARGLKGTFFVTGRWVTAYPDAARRIVADGHEIGNHSLTHPFFTQIGLDGVAPELDKTEQIVRQVTGASTRPYFRFPYGASSQATIDIIAADGYVPYHWSADDVAIAGWMTRAAANPAQVYGDILLMHQRKSTVDALPGWLDQLAAMGLRPVPLGEILR
jgi:peptidoglycan/xylan/chitin deacetylase (PgdA/CDA1 family)